MEYILDTANIEAIKHCNEFYPLAGVTTNPSIIAKEKKDFWELVREIRSIIGPKKLFFAQTVATKADKIIEEAVLLNEKSGGEFCVKIPISEEGLKATMELKKRGIKVLMTAIFTPAQALVAARAGADYVAPYVNRLDNIMGNGFEVAAEIVKEFNIHGFPCKVLVASFKNAQQVQNCTLAGCQCVTVTADILEALIKHPMTDAAIEGFEKDWAETYGDKTILDL